MPDEPSLPTVLREVMDSRLLELQTALPGSIVKYDTASETATVKVMVKNRVPSGSGFLVEEEYEEIDDVPVVCPRGS